MIPPKVLILGATGMLGHTLFRDLTATRTVDVYGTARSVAAAREAAPAALAERIVPGVDALNMDSVSRVLGELQPDIVVNCVGVIKQDPGVKDLIRTISVNSLFPHLLAQECARLGARLIHVSTDCVFSGARGGYKETDNPDPSDGYGRSKLIGELTEAPCLTLRTSIIGHEIGTRRSLVDWFLSQTGVVNGYTRAIYTGVTTTEFANLLSTVVFPRPELIGLLQVASQPISKYELLRLIAQEYGWEGTIEPYDDFVCDRSLSGDAFHALTGYRPPAWPAMIAEMRRADAPSPAASVPR